MLAIFESEINAGIMKTSKYLLIYSIKAKRYVLVKSSLQELMGQSTEVIWSFDSNKLNVAKKLLKNMNLASKLEDDEKSLEIA